MGRGAMPKGACLWQGGVRRPVNSQTLAWCLNSKACAGSMINFDSWKRGRKADALGFALDWHAACVETLPMNPAPIPAPRSDAMDRSDGPPAALDAFGFACLTVAQADGRCLWRTALARSLMAEFFVGGHFERGYLPPELLLWMHREALRRRVGAQAVDLTVVAQTPSRFNPTLAARRAPLAALGSRLSFRLHAVDAEVMGEGQWLIVMSKH